MAQSAVFIEYPVSPLATLSTVTARVRFVGNTLVVDVPSPYADATPALQLEPVQPVSRDIDAVAAPAEVLQLVVYWNLPLSTVVLRHGPALLTTTGTDVTFHQQGVLRLVRSGPLGAWVQI